MRQAAFSEKMAGFLERLGQARNPVAEICHGGWGAFIYFNSSPSDVVNEPRSSAVQPQKKSHRHAVSDLAVVSKGYI